jgi:hypothetical protein
MAFWQATDIEPKRSYRFILSIPGISSYIIKSVKKPSFTIGSTPHQYLNHTFHYPGRVTWDDITFVIVDTVGDTDNGSARLMGLLDACGYSLPDPKSYATISKKSAVSALSSVQIHTIDAQGEVKESWWLNNAWIQQASFGDLSYEDEGMLNVSVTLKYDNAGLNTKTPAKNYPTGFNM